MTTVFRQGEQCGMEIKKHLILSALGSIALLSGNFTSSTALGCGACGGGGGDLPLGVRTSVDRPLIAKNGSDSKVVIKIEIEGRKIGRVHRTPLNLAIVLDRSGSMAGAKLEQAKEAAQFLVNQLQGDDVLSVVLYDTEVEVVVPAGQLKDRAREINRIIGRIETGGSTALYAGVEQGGGQLREYLSHERINRVILLSDGIANIGPSSNSEIAKLGSRLAREGGSVTTIGLGNDYNETLMTSLAEASDANYYYVADVESLPEVFEAELGELQSIVARDITIEIRCPKGVRPVRFLGRPGILSKRSESVAFGTVSSEQVRELYLECEIEPDAMGKTTEIAEVAVTFTEGSSTDKQSLNSVSVVVGYTGDLVLAERSVDRAICAEAAIFANALETERAIALADQGNITDSKAQITRQTETLRAVYAAAPAALQSLLKSEIRELEETASDLDDNKLSKEQRKKLSNGSWELRNSKRAK